MKSHVKAVQPHCALQSAGDSSRPRIQRQLAGSELEIDLSFLNLLVPDELF